MLIKLCEGVRNKYQGAWKSTQECACSNSIQILCVDSTGNNLPISTYTSFYWCLTLNWHQLRMSKVRHLITKAMTTNINWPFLGSCNIEGNDDTAVVTVVFIFLQDRAERLEWMRTAHTVGKHKVWTVARAGQQRASSRLRGKTQPTAPRREASTQKVTCLSLLQLTWVETENILPVCSFDQ